MIILNKYPPQPYGNLKALCDDLKVSYHTYKAKDFPFFIGEIEVFKIPVKRGGRKIKQKEQPLVIGSALYHIAKDGYSRESVCGLSIEEMKTKQDNCVAHPYEKMIIKSGAVVCEKCLDHYR